MWRLKIAEENGETWLKSMNNHVGRQHWEFDPDDGTPEEQAQVENARQVFTKNRFRTRQSSDNFMRTQLRKENGSEPIPAAVKVKETEDITEEAVTTTLRRGISYFSSIQAHDGHWPSENAGPLFFLPPMVLALYITGSINTVLSPEHNKEMKRYIYNHQNEDGGHGFHIEGNSTMFSSVLNYITLRLLGEGPDDGVNMAMARSRNWILDHGGALTIPSWGKFWLAILGVYDWSGCLPMPPELWILPKFTPIHPSKLFSYCRLTYIPMSYLYGKRFVAPITQSIRSLRRELFTEPYDEINWRKARHTVAKEDLYYQHPLVQDMMWEFLHYVYEPILQCWPFSMLRKKALKKAVELIHYEDENSRYFSIGCIIKAISLVSCWVEDPNSDAYKCHLARMPDYFWVAEDGLKVQSFGSQMWDTALAVQAILSTGLTEEYLPTLQKAHNFVKASQIQENPSGDFTEMFRHISKGGWTFSILDHGWQVSDGTGDGLKVSLMLSQISQEFVGEKMETGRLYDAVNIILSLQNESTGGLSGWEPVRGFRWLEKFNPVEFFEDTFIEREYVECTSSAIQGLILFKKLHPTHRREELETCISRAISYIENTQNPDGSWYGCWGICFTYGTWFAVEGLAASGKKYHDSPALRKACEFLISKQLPSGGWGESYLSCRNKVYINLEGDRVNLVQTAWALLALMGAGQAEIDPTPIRRGIMILINSQLHDGDFPQQEITGAFMKNNVLHYGAYRNIFPIWALGEYRRHICNTL